MVDERQAIGALDQVLELVVFLGDDMAQALARDQLTASRATLIWILGQRGPSTQRSLADAMGLSARTITALVDGLVTTGFVTREAHPSDRRATLVTLTPHGAATTERLQREQRQLARAVFGDWSEQRLRAFTGSLRTLMTRLRELSEAANA